MKTLYLITKILTYPGAFMKGFWEHVTCRILKLQVTDRRYLRPNEFCGHTAHTPAMTPAKAFLLSFLPYAAQRILGWIFVGASAAPLLLFSMRSRAENPLFTLEIVALFLGLSLLCNSFPQWEDAKRHWRLFYGGPTPEEEQAMQAYSDALLAAFDAADESAADGEAEPEAEAEIEVEQEAAPEAEMEAETEIETEAALDPEPEEPADEAPALPETPEAPRFAGLAGKIIFAPCNAYFLAGAWLEKFGIPVIAAIVITAALLVLR